MKESSQERNCDSCRAEIAERIHRIILMFMLSEESMPEAAMDELKKLFIKLKLRE